MTHSLRWELCRKTIAREPTSDEFLRWIDTYWRRFGNEKHIFVNCARTPRIEKEFDEWLKIKVENEE